MWTVSGVPKSVLLCTNQPEINKGTSLIKSQFLGPEVSTIERFPLHTYVYLALQICVRLFVNLTFHQMTTAMMNRL